MRKCMFCLAIDNSNSFRNNDDNCATIKKINGEMLAPILEIEGRTMEELKITLNKTITETFDKIITKQKMVKKLYNNHKEK